MNRDKKVCVDAITNISSGISELPCQSFDIEHKVLPNETVKHEFPTMIYQLVDDQFSLASFDKLIEIQVNLDNLASFLKKAKRDYVEVEDSISHVHAILNATSRPDKSEMQATLARFEEFQKINEGRK